VETAIKLEISADEDGNLTVVFDSARDRPIQLGPQGYLNMRSPNGMAICMALTYVEEP
jgi:hypothetical protein